MAEGQPRVLVVEDNEVNQALAVAILAKLGYHADVVGDGGKAVDLVPRGDYQAVLMDCQLPVLDGYQATAEIRRREGSGRRTPIIAMTAAVLQDGEACLAAGMDDRIAKPVLLAEVQAVLARWLQGGGGQPDARWTGRPAASTGEVLDQRRLAELGGLDPAGAGRPAARQLPGQDPRGSCRPPNRLRPRGCGSGPPSGAPAEGGRRNRGKQRHGQPL